MKSLQRKSSLIKHTIKCKRQNQALHICTNVQCKQKKIFTCGVSMCSCRKSHLECSKADIQGILDKISKKISQSDRLKDHVEKVFDEIIDKMNATKQMLLESIEQDLKMLNLHKIEKHFLKIIQNQNSVQQFTNQQSSFLWKNICNKKQVKHKTFQQIHQIIKDYQQNSKENIKIVTKNIDQLIATLARQNSVLLKRQKVVIQKMIETSSIVKDNIFGLKLLMFFPKRISKLKLLYKASQNNFSVQKFYELYGKDTNTMLLCLTNKDKIVGGYTPYAYYSGKKQWVFDQNLESFMFSLTNNQKFNLKESQKCCLLRNQFRSAQITFGFFQIYIKNKQDNTTLCMIGNKKQQSSCYQYNENYKLNDKQFYQKLNGNQSCFCSLKQWQFWKIQFQQQSQQPQQQKNMIKKQIIQLD